LAQEESRRLEQSAKTRAGEDALAQIEGELEDYRPRLVRYLELRTKSFADANDLAQEAYFRLCRVKHPELIRQPDSYLFRIASNLLGEFMLRKRQQGAVMELDADHDLFEGGDQGAFTDELETRSEVKKLNAILDDLPPLYRTILLMRKRDGFSHNEIAEQLSISPHTVQKYLTRAVLRCRTIWAEKYDG